MKHICKIISIIIIGFIISGSVFINKENYKKHTEIRYNYVNHPEGLITKELAKATSFWFANLRADLLWLQTIQYIWWNAVSSEYKKYLFAIIDVITELNPYFEHPYIIAQLLLPWVNERYENLSDEEVNKHTNQAIEMWLKWIQNFCNATENPCKSYKIPYYLAYLYFHYQDDPATASDYYKIASANNDSVEWAKSMAAIMAGKWWNREKSIFMFLNIAESLDTSTEQQCSLFSQELNNVSTGIFITKELALSDELLQSIQNIRIQAFWEFSEDEEKQLSDTECINFLNKANRELNLAFLDQANEKYKIDNDWKNAIDGKELLEKWYINFLPTDFQQYEDYGIRYEYNEDIWNFDYNMNF